MTSTHRAYTDAGDRSAEGARQHAVQRDDQDRAERRPATPAAIISVFLVRAFRRSVAVLRDDAWPGRRARHAVQCAFSAS